MCKKLILSVILGLSMAFSIPAAAQTTLTSMRHVVLSAEGTVIDSPDYAIESLLLPRQLYILQGTSAQIGRYNLYFKNVLLSNSKVNTINLDASSGQMLTGRWLYKDVFENGQLQNNHFSLSLKATSSDGTTSLNKTMNVDIIDKTNKTPVRLLAIGDSLTRAGIYLTQIKNNLPNVETVGTRLYPGEDYPREGRGGWTFERYFKNINSKDLDSPFVFPVDVDGYHYKGNTRDWQSICYTNPKYYLYDGFQKIARGWSDTGAYLYDENGYYKHPEIGDVMVDPTRPEGQQWVEWNGFSWETRPVQPTAFEFNFTKYMQRFADAFPNGAPTHVSILLGTNDFGVANGFNNVAEYLSYYKEAISSIHTYDPNIKVLVCTLPLGPNETMIDDYNWRYTRFDRNTKLATYYLLKTFDTDEALLQNTYIAPMHLNLDTTNGFDYKEATTQLNGAAATVRVPVNSIHPNNTVGQLQMGDALSSIIQKTR